MLAGVVRPLVGAWLGILAEPARGGFHRYLGWTLALLPLPRDWPAAVRLLAPPLPLPMSRHQVVGAVRRLMESAAAISVSVLPATSSVSEPISTGRRP